MSTEHVVSKHPGRTSRRKQFALLLAGIALLLTLFLPGPASTSTSEVEVTATVFLNPLEVIASAPSQVLVGKLFRVEAIIMNHGDLKVVKAAASIYLPKDIEIVVGDPTQNLGNIMPQKSKTVTWRLRALKEGNYVILISASGSYGGTIVPGEDTVLVAATAR